MRTLLLLFVLPALSLGASVSATVTHEQRTGLYHGCAECRTFVARLTALGADAPSSDAIATNINNNNNNNVKSNGANKGGDEFPEVAAELSNAREERLCGSLQDAREAAACVDVAQVYGLENAAAVASAAPDLLCEQLRGACGAKTTAPSASRAGTARLDKNQVAAVLGDVLVQSSESKTGVSKGVMGMMSSLFKMRMQSQMMMQAMQMRQQLMENEHKMMQKVMRAMARNRAIRSELKHLKKMAYRSQPGNCDCCDGCLPPAEGKKH